MAAAATCSNSKQSLTMCVLDDFLIDRTLRLNSRTLVKPCSERGQTQIILSSQQLSVVHFVQLFGSTRANNERSGRFLPFPVFTLPLKAKNSLPWSRDFANAR